MAEKTAPFPQVTVVVTKEEFEQFINDHTYLPSCMVIDDKGLFTCRGNCPENLVNIRFTYIDPQKNLQYEWFACAPAAEYQKLSDRFTSSAKPDEPRKVKYITYTLD